MTEIKFNLLEVDLTQGTSRVVDVTEDVRKYLGGWAWGHILEILLFVGWQRSCKLLTLSVSGFIL